ncbi:MAG: glycoside hydrolase family 28 protein [Ignavibacteriales bacterium]|nr:MAG: glycoside hydrolase family 28 protein [Ignavibacteriales bacterium]
MKIFNHKNIFLLALLLVAASLSCSTNNTSTPGDEWVQVEQILNRIKPPQFPERIFNITDFGAKADGETDCTVAFKSAIAECSKNGGGMVYVPEGIFLTGAIHLKSNVNLHLAENAVIKFSDDKAKYLPLVFSRWEGVECMNYSSLLYAYGQENIAVTGKGILDGQGSVNNWWPWKGKKEGGWKTGEPHQKEGRDKLFKMAEDNIPPEERIMGEGYYLRPNFVHFYKTKNILIEGVTFKDSPMWFINPVLCENISVLGVTVEGLGPNNDGCNPESCKDVLIKDCYFNTGDDCIAIKSGRNNDGRRINVPSENIVIQNCIMKEGHGGVVLGSEISGGVKNVFAENCKMDSPHLERAFRIKTNSVRGGIIENIHVRNIEVGEVSEAVIKINFYYEEGDAGKFIPVVKNISIKNVTAQKSEFAVWIKAYEHSPVKNVLVENCTFNKVKNESVIENVEGLTIRSSKINDKEFLR